MQRDPETEVEKCDEERDRERERESRGEEEWDRRSKSQCTAASSVKGS
jgi:hypothetical protein